MDNQALLFQFILGICWSYNNIQGSNSRKNIVEQNIQYSLPPKQGGRSHILGIKMQSCIFTGDDTDGIFKHKIYQSQCNEDFKQKPNLTFLERRICHDAKTEIQQKEFFQYFRNTHQHVHHGIIGKEINEQKIQKNS